MIVTTYKEHIIMYSVHPDFMNPSQKKSINSYGANTTSSNQS